MTNKPPIDAIELAKNKKPKYGEKCNGCGLCCMMEVCAIGKEAYGKDQKAPCPALIHASNRHWCKFVLAEDLLRTEPIIQNALGIGKGCCAEIQVD